MLVKKKKFEGKFERMLFDGENESFGICTRNVNFNRELQNILSGLLVSDNFTLRL